MQPEGKSACNLCNASELATSQRRRGFRMRSAMSSRLSTQSTDRSRTVDNCVVAYASRKSSHNICGPVVRLVRGSCLMPRTSLASNSRFCRSASCSSRPLRYMYVRRRRNMACVFNELVNSLRSQRWLIQENSQRIIDERLAVLGGQLQNPKVLFLAILQPRSAQQIIRHPKTTGGKQRITITERLKW